MPRRCMLGGYTADAALAGRSGLAPEASQRVAGAAAILGPAPERLCSRGTPDLLPGMDRADPGPAVPCRSASLWDEGKAQSPHSERREAMNDFDCLGRGIAKERPFIAYSRAKPKDEELLRALLAPVRPAVRVQADR